MRVSIPATGVSPEIRGTAEHVGGGNATFRDERELAAFLHHCLCLRAPASDQPAQRH